MRGMLRRYGANRPHILLVIAVAGAAAGCSNSASRVATAQMFAASNPAATSGVEAQPLSPLNASAYASPTNPALSGGFPPAGVNATGLASRGWSLDGAPVVEVTSADTAVTLSQGYGVPVGVILEANGLSSPTDVMPGQRLVIPTYVRRDTPAASAPTVLAGPGTPPTTLNDQAGITTAAKTATTAATASSHTVAPGETLWSISQRYNVSPGDVMAMNNLPADGTVRLGETLKLPGSATTEAPYQVAAVDPKTTSGTLSDTVNTALTPASAANAPKAAAPAKTAAPAAADPQPASTKSTTGTEFRWPVRGQLVAGFGKQADGARNDGINLAVPAGTPVRAAETGTVIYAGNELEGYGNLVLVQHNDDWVSAYAHNEALTVRRGDTVTRGQTIASAGATGSVDAPQLHFELRKSSRPVDPLPHLDDA